VTVPWGGVATDMVGLLDIEELDTNLYRGYKSSGRPNGRPSSAARSRPRP
jgi:hypothetical protein